MKRITQTKFHADPTPESRGNCQQAAVASLLGLELDEVPNFMEAENFWCAVEDFFKSRGLCLIRVSPGIIWPGKCNYLAYGPSKRGVRHACIYNRGVCVWDPHPSRTGLLEVDEINVVVPADLAEWRRES